MDHDESTKSFVPLGTTNLAYEKGAYQSSMYYSNFAAYAVDGDMSGAVQFASRGSCSLTNRIASEHSHLVVDLGALSVVEDVVAFTTRGGDWWTERFTHNGGTLVGLSPGWGPGYNEDIGYSDDDGTLGSADCWGQGDCDTNENVTVCGIASEYAQSGQHHVNCGGAIGRYLFLWQVNPENFLAVCEVAAWGYPYNATTYGAGSPAPTTSRVLKPSAQPTLPPSVQPSWHPSPAPSSHIESNPSSLPSSAPSVLPIPMPSASPISSTSSRPTPVPTSAPTKQPTTFPTILPSALPSLSPSVAPIAQPTPRPSPNPSVLPSATPSQLPTLPPSVAATISSKTPTPAPTLQPVVAVPSPLPFPAPSPEPTLKPFPAPTAGPTQAPTAAPFVQVLGYETIDAKYQVFVSPGRSRDFWDYRVREESTTVQAKGDTILQCCMLSVVRLRTTAYDRGLNQVLCESLLCISSLTYFNQGYTHEFSFQTGIDWDEAADQCLRRGMELASVNTAGEQSALASAVAAAMVAETNYSKIDGTRGYSFGAEFDRVWLGARRSDAQPYWHWRDGRNVWENEYTNWADGFEYSDSQVYSFYYLSQSTLM